MSLVIFSESGTAQTSPNCANSALNGLYRVDVEQSDRLFSILEEATSNLPFGEQQLFFVDLAVRLTPPDLLAIECRGKNVSLGSSRAPRVEFLADGITRSVKNSDGRTVRSRIAFDRNSLSFTSTGGDDNLNFTFTPLENGSRLRVTRRISARELTEPIVIQTVYNKISGIARWDVFDDSQLARKQNQPEVVEKTSSIPASRTDTIRRARAAGSEAETLSSALGEWIEATNQRDIGAQMSFYMPQVKAYYLARNVSRSFIRKEKNRVFALAKNIDIRAAEPEIIFQDGGRTAVMRFRKKYNVANGTASRRGEVVQELRWQQTPGGWRIFSERDIKVIR